jgi:outer membrane lipoprotein-sorting protein
MFRVIIFFLILNFYNTVDASVNDKIILKLKETNNLSFYFKQMINEKSENGNCIIKYPKKIFCEYKNKNKKIIVSNGKSLVIKNRNSGISYLYPLNRTPLQFLLDKNYLIKKISALQAREVENKYINFNISENNNEINIFFDKETFDLIGWQTEDVYQNLTITFISLVKINQKINDNIFILPKLD